MNLLELARQTRPYIEKAAQSELAGLYVEAVNR